MKWRKQTKPYSWLQCGFVGVGVFIGMILLEPVLDGVGIWKGAVISGVIAFVVAIISEFIWKDRA